MWSRILLIFALAAALPAWAQTLAETLPNGMKVIVKEDARAPVAVAQLWYRVGSADEVAGKTGLSHALEHMMFKGTPSVPSGEFSRRVSALGGQNNAYTNRHETVYFETVAAANLPEVLKMEADRMANLNFSNQDFTNEMSVIREERRQRTEDSPGGKLWEQLYLSSFQTDANRAPIIGYMADLHALKAADLRRWYRRWYAPNNAVLVIVGDVDAAQTLRTVQQLFGPIQARTLPERQNLAEPQVRAPARAETRAVTHQRGLCAHRIAGVDFRSGHTRVHTRKLFVADAVAGNVGNFHFQQLLQLGHIGAAGRHGHQRKQSRAAAEHIIACAHIQRRFFAAHQIFIEAAGAIAAQNIGQHIERIRQRVVELFQGGHAIAEREQGLVGHGAGFGACRRAHLRLGQILALRQRACLNRAE